MADEKSNPTEEDSFKFVDKRKTAIEAESVPAVETDDAGDVPTAAETNESVDADVDEMIPEAEGIYGIVSYTIGLLSMSAWQYLGLIADPQSGKAKRDLKQAHIAIDCVGGLVDALEKNAGSVDNKTMSDLKRVLNDLRLNFVTQSNMPDSGT